MSSQVGLGDASVVRPESHGAAPEIVGELHRRVTQTSASWRLS